ncbi:HAD family hydrolase [Psychromonas sp. PT13]|uniref:HAD family hydrolase n=1 Tax=Psychromonas sp. PT13 TaxID=3439547 RepID=UPI003EBEAD09
MIKCIIFDCDGTLVDSEFLCNLALEIKLKDYGVKAYATELVDRFRGVKLTAILKAMETEHHIVLAENFEASYRSLVNELFEARLKACEGVHDMLDELVDYPKCVASSGPLNKINKALSITDLSDYFNDNIYSAHEVKSWKPDPGLFLHAAKAMGFTPDECLVVEDSEVGITAAKSAGMKAILYDPHKIHDPELSQDVIYHMNELKQVIKSF